MPIDTASVAVVDGKKLLITPFRTQNVPPPMSSYHLDLPRTPIHVSFSQHEDALVVLFEDGNAQVWDLDTKLPVGGSSRLRGGGKVADPKLRFEHACGSNGRALQATLGKDSKLGVLVQSETQNGKHSSVTIRDANGAVEDHKLNGPVERLLDIGSEIAVLESESGDVYQGRSWSS